MEKIIEITNNLLTNPDKVSQWKANQYKKILDIVFEQIDDSYFNKDFNGFADSLKNKINNYKERSREFNSRINENESLINEKEKVENEHNNLVIKIEELEKLKSQRKFIEHNDLGTIIKDISENSAVISETKDKYNEILYNLNTLLEDEESSQNKQLKQSVLTAINNLKILEEHQKGLLDKLEITTLDTNLTYFKNEVEVLTKDYNTRVEKINGVKEDLDEIKEKHSGIMEVFNLHHLENNNVFGELQRREGVLKHVQSIRDEIKEKLNTYDTEIKTLVDKRDELPIYELKEMKNYD